MSISPGNFTHGMMMFGWPIHQLDEPADTAGLELDPGSGLASPLAAIPPLSYTLGM